LYFDEDRRYTPYIYLGFGFIFKIEERKREVLIFVCKTRKPKIV
jgi:hypothetical protein